MAQDLAALSQLFFCLRGGHVAKASMGVAVATQLVPASYNLLDDLRIATGYVTGGKKSCSDLLLRKQLQQAGRSLFDAAIAG